MAQIVKETVIDRPIDEVYEFCFQPGNFILMPGITEAKREGNTYSVKGEEKIPVIGLELVSYKIYIDRKKKPTYISFHTEDYLIKAKGVWQLRKHPEGTTLKYTLDYKVPFLFLGKIIDKLAMQKQIDKEVAEYLENIQKALEKVERIMSTDVVTIEHLATAADAIEKMNKANVRYLVVVEKNRIVGVITDGDVVSRIYTQGFSPNSHVAEIMTREVTTIEPEACIVEAISLMSARKIRRLPVVKGKHLVGLLSITDLDQYLGLFGKR